MLVCCAIYSNTRAFGLNTYRMYNKDTKKFDDIDEYALRNFLKSGGEVSNLKLDDNGNIVGYGIDIKRLKNFDGSNKLTVISELTDDKENVIGYEAITTDSRVVQVSKKDIDPAAKWGRVTNMTYIEDKGYTRLITKNGVDTKVKTLDYINMDTSWDTSMNTAKNIFKACGFELGYSERYSYVEDYTGVKEQKDSVFNIMYDKNGNILYFDESLSNKDKKLCYHGGHLVTETLGGQNRFLQGSSATTESLYTGIKYTYNTFDIREKFVANYKEVIESQQPVPYMLDDNGRTVYDLGLATKEMIDKRKRLTKELEKDDDLFGFGLEYLVFIHYKYHRFNDRLKQILKVYYDNSLDMIIRLAVEDILEFGTNKVDKNKFNNMVIMLHTFCGDYEINENWAELLKTGIDKERVKREEAKKKAEEERNKRVAEARKKVEMQSKGALTGLFGMFSKK